LYSEKDSVNKESEQIKSHRENENNGEYEFSFERFKNPNHKNQIEKSVKSGTNTYSHSVVNDKHQISSNH